MGRKWKWGRGNVKGEGGIIKGGEENGNRGGGSVKRGGRGG